MQFNFENAFMHFARTGAPRGFVWKLALTYLAGSILIGALSMLLMGGWYASLFAAYGSQDPEAIMAASQMSGGMMALIYLIILPLSLFFYAIFEASYLRRYMRRDRFFLRIGRDEWNVFVVLLIWFALFIVLMIALGLIIGLIAIIGVVAVGGTGGGDEPSMGLVYVLMALLYLIIGGAMAFFGVKFSPAAAMTIRDRKIRFVSAWGATRGKFWPLLGAYAAWFLLGFVGYIVAMFTLIALAAGSFASIDAENTDPLAMMAGFGPIVIILYLLLLAAGICFYYIWAGPAALAAKTDPRLVQSWDTVSDDVME